jgi:hypothetical protein
MERMLNIKMKQTKIGTLCYNDNAEYEIHINMNSDNQIQVFNLSSLLDRVYKTKSIIGIHILDGSKTLFNEKSKLYKTKDEFNIDSYFILGSNLEQILFDNTDKNLEFIFDTNFIIDVGEHYGQIYSE